MSIKKYNFDYVKRFFNDAGVELLSKEEDYINSASKVQFLCKCGRIGIKRFGNILYSKLVICTFCGRSKAEKGKIAKNNGIHRFQTNEFKENRIKYNIERYGVPYVSQTDEFKKKSEDTCLNRYGYKRATQHPDTQKKRASSNLQKYGVEHFLQNPENVEKVRKTNIDRYGIPYTCLNSGSFSKESQILFNNIHSELTLGIKTKNHFGSLNSEFTINVGQDYYKYDFVNSIAKVVIEYNGSKFHPKPEQKEDEIGWCVFHPNKTVKDAREYEARKFSAIEQRGYKILVIWDYEYKKDKEGTVKRCLDFIQSNIKA